MRKGRTLPPAAASIYLRDTLAQTELLIREISVIYGSVVKLCEQVLSAMRGREDEDKETSW